ncbi:sensor histidine kinase [Amycolatopsis pigmentata]|uniref:histidine kinase n=1 Tax=Amycolatopsis pigmentata TaxID=450801 RepID=A0ABW5G3K4_9PSEU
MLKISRLWPASIRRGNTLAAALICALLFTVGALGVHALVSHELSATAKNATTNDLDRLVSAYRVASRGGGRTALASAVLSDPMFVVVADSGKAVVTSDAIARLSPQWTIPGPAPAGAPADWTTTTSVTLRSDAHPNWREFRTYTVFGRVVDDVPAGLVEPLGRAGSTLDSGLSGSGNGSFRLTVYLFVPPWNTIQALQLFDNTMAGFVPLAVVIVALVAWFASGSALRSVEAIRRELAEVSGNRLDRRVPVPRSHDEVARLAVTTNDTLDRLQQAHLRQERFVADASHELRSPLASLRTGLEVALAHRDRADWPAVAERSLLDVSRLQRITADLLQLAVEDGHPPSDLVDVADLVTEQLAERSLGTGPAVLATVAGAALVRGDSVQLERLLRNLLDNAVRHARSSVRVTVSESDGAVVLEVVDDGPGVAGPDRERVFDRFVRLDEARARDAGGAGLGLTLARDIALRHDGTLRIEDGDAGARFVARLPRA